MGKMTKPLTHIGRHTQIALPDQDAFAVPAKIDTGADSSSLWATNIRQEAQGLTFVLFDKNSPWYTGGVVKVDNYEIVSIKNSFGASEIRYKVKLVTRIEGRRVRVAYTLADRSRSQYPVLIGRNTLKNKFVVDVAQQSGYSGGGRVLFVSKKYSPAVEKMTRRIAQRSGGKLTVDYATYDDMTVRIVDQMMSVQVNSTALDLAEYDLVHFKTSLSRDMTAALTRYAEASGVRVLDAESIRHFPTTSKLYEYAILCHEKIAVPDSLFVAPVKWGNMYKECVVTLGLPFVMKGIHASKGDMNEVVRDEQSYRRVIEEARARDAQLIAQRFVPNSGDYRLLVLGKKLRLAIYRQRQNDSTHLNNTSTGGGAMLVDLRKLPGDVRADALRAAAAMGRDVAGVDYMKNDTDGTWVCLEVNDGPQIASGAFVEEKSEVLTKYLLKRLEK